MATTQTKRNIDYFWMGFIVYTVSYTLSISDKANYILCNVIQLLGLFFIIPASINLIRAGNGINSKYLKLLLSLYFLWLLTMIVRGFLFDYLFYKKMLFDAYGGLFLYLVPFVILFPETIYNIKKAFRTIVVLGVVYIIFIVLFSGNIFNINDIAGRADLEYFAKTLAMPCGFMLLTFPYQSNTRKIFVFGIVLISVLLSVMRARRGLVFVFMTEIFASYIVYAIYKRWNKIIGLVFSLFLVFILFNYGIAIVKSGTNFFSYFNQRLNEDSRAIEEQYFFLDLTPKDWLIGKGISGTYHCPTGVNDNLYGIKGYRDGIETNYLTIILKGGIINLLLLLLMTLPAAYKGIIKSTNILSKACGFWIVLWLLYLYPTNVTTFTLQYIIVWISVGVCYSDEIRNLSEENHR